MSASKNRAFATLVLLFVGVAAIVLGLNHISANRHMAAVTASDVRNDGMQVIAYHRGLVIPNSIVVDVRRVPGTASRLDVTRVLLQFAEQVQHRSFARVFLAHKGSLRFYLDGEYFRDLGREYAWQNPVYTLRTLPQNVRRLDGTSAFPAWTGGVLGVVGAQMDDLNNLHDQWYLNDFR